MDKNLSIKLITLLCALSCLYSFANTSKTSFYQCETENGVTFSQLPCSESAKLKTISTFTPRKIRSTDVDLNSLQTINREQKLTILQSRIKISENKIRQMRRAKAKEKSDSEQQLERMMDETAKKLLAKQVKKDIKRINEQYDSQIKQQEETLKQLKNEVKSFNKSS